MKKIKLYFLIAAGVLLVGLTGCKRDTFTDDSSLTPTNPTISVDLPAGVTSLVEADVSYTFDLTLSEAQIVDVVVYVSQVAGTATVGTDFTIENSAKATFPAYSTKASVTIAIKADDIAEDAETFTLQIGDERTANATFAPVTVDFELLNLEDGDLNVGLSWATDALTSVSIDLAPTDAVDLRFLIFHADTLYGTADGSGFESYIIPAGAPDGEYLLATDIYSTVNAGDFNNNITLDLNLEYNQAGKINGSQQAFPAVMTNEFSCDLFRTNLATVTKSGTAYDIQKAISYTKPDDGVFAGTWDGTDAVNYPSEVESQLDGATLTITGLGFGWMLDFWGETVLENNFVNMNVNWCEGKLSIPEQDYIVTLYNGVEYPYTIVGSGEFDNSGPTPGFIVRYDMIQEGFSTAGWMFDSGNSTTPFFEAFITLQ